MLHLLKMVVGMHPSTGSYKSVSGCLNEMKQLQQLDPHICNAGIYIDSYTIV